MIHDELEEVYGRKMGEKEWYRYPLCKRQVVPVPIDSKGLVPVQVKVVPVPLLPATLFLHVIHF